MRSAVAPVWGQPEFLKVWAASSISAVGSQVTVLAVPLTAVLVFGAGPAETGLLTAVGVAPNLLLGLVAGAWVDRLPRRPVRIAADLASAVVIATIPGAALLGVLRLEHLYAVAFLAGCCTVFARISVTAMVPALVGRHNLLEANSMLISSFSLSQIIGPSLAGVLVQIISPPLALLADAASFLVSAGTFLRVRVAEPAVGASSRPGIWHEIMEGLVWLRGEPILFRLTVCIGLANLAWYGVQAVVVVFATADLGLSPAMLGLSLGAIGPASLVGALVSAHMARRLGLGPTLVIALSGEALSRVVLLLAGGPPLAAALTIGLSQAIFGFIAPLWDVNSNSLRQTATPERLLGRVSAASTFVGVGMAPIGALLAGWIGQVAGLRVALLEATFVTLIAVLVLVWSPVPRLRDPASAARGRSPLSQEA
jgi:predicted MFS family arabinose efflux permease